MTIALLAIIGALILAIVFLAHDLTTNNQASEPDPFNIDRFMANYGIQELDRYRQAIQHAGFWHEFNLAYVKLNGIMAPDESTTNP